MPNNSGVKTGGRKKGTANRLTTEYKELIESCGTIEFLIDAFTNGYIENKALTKARKGKDSEYKHITEYLTAKERCDVAASLAKKIVPDLKAMDHTTGGGGQFTITVNKAPMKEVS